MFLSIFIHLFLAVAQFSNSKAQVIHTVSFAGPETPAHTPALLLQQVNVGVEGSFFNPPTTSAQVNDTIVFVFGGE